MFDAAEVSTDPLSKIAALAGVADSPRLKRALALYAAGVLGYNGGRAAWRWWEARSTYTVSVSGDDDVYNDVHRYILDLMPERRRRALTARTKRVRSAEFAELVSPDSPQPAKANPLHLLYDGTVAQHVTIGGHSVRVHLEQPPRDARLSEEDRARYPFLAALERIVFTARGEEGRDAVLGFLRDVTDRRNAPEKRRPEFHICTRWGHWSRRSDIPRRPPETVVLAGSLMDDLVGDLGRFLGAGDEYLRLGIPYHRGYLLHGPPGTGKTSIAKALATRFDLDIRWIPLGDLTGDASLLQLVSDVDPGSLLLLEDVDVLKVATDAGRDETTRDGISLSGLLNALDGVGTPHGLVTVMTTNRREKLEGAVVRPGRIDRDILIGHLEDDQLARLIEQMTGVDDFVLPSVQGLSVTPADVVDVLKRHLYEPDPRAGVAAVAEFVYRRLVDAMASSRLPPPL